MRQSKQTGSRTGQLDCPSRISKEICVSSESADSRNRKGHGAPKTPIAEEKQLPLTSGFTTTPAFMISASVHQP